MLWHWTLVSAYSFSDVCLDKTCCPHRPCCSSLLPATSIAVVQHALPATRASLSTFLLPHSHLVGHILSVQEACLLSALSYLQLSFLLDNCSSSTSGSACFYPFCNSFPKKQSSKKASCHCSVLNPAVIFLFWLKPQPPTLTCMLHTLCSQSASLSPAPGTPPPHSASFLTRSSCRGRTANFALKCCCAQVFCCSCPLSSHHPVWNYSPTITSHVLLTILLFSISLWPRIILMWSNVLFPSISHHRM